MPNKDLLLRFIEHNFIQNWDSYEYELRIQVHFLFSLFVNQTISSDQLRSITEKLEVELSYPTNCLIYAIENPKMLIFDSKKQILGLLYENLFEQHFSMVYNKTKK